MRRAITKATRLFDHPDEVAKLSRGLSVAMVGFNVEENTQTHRLARRGG